MVALAQPLHLPRSREPTVNAAPAVDFAVLVREHGAALRTVALRLTRAPAEADDLVQDTFERALRNLDRFEPGSHPRAWLCTLMRNLHIDRLRRTRVESVPVAELERVAPEPEPPAGAWEGVSVEQVGAAIARLPDEFRAVYTLAAQGVTYPQIAERLGIAKNTVGTRMLRARQRLRELLTREERP